MAKLEIGSRMKTILNREITILAELGEGGQGYIYKIDYRGEEKVLKWYKPEGMGNNPEKYYANLKKNMEKGAPSPEFLWPIDMVDWKDHVFGYVMDLIPAGYYEVKEYMLTNVRFSSYRTIIDASLQIIHAFRVLHNEGYSYEDLNDGNFLIDPVTGKVKICDADNIAPNKTATGMVGKPRYMAPEIVMRKNMPDKLSDRFSMAVILFILFCLVHPLEGKRSLVPVLTPQLAERLYGSEALFIMDPEDDRNKPNPKIHSNVLMVWPFLPEHIKDLFLRSFSQKGLFQPHTRPSENEWEKGFVRFRSDVVGCPCGNELFSENGAPIQCEKCGRLIAAPYLLQLPDYALPAVRGTRLYKCQTMITDYKDSLDRVAMIVMNKETGQYGLKNFSDHAWQAVTPSGKSRTVGPGGVVPLKEGISITINQTNIKINQNT